MMDLTAKEIARVEKIGVDVHGCKHVVRIVYGLPRAHKLVEWAWENCLIAMT